MSRDEMLELLLELESAAETYNAGYSSAKLAKAIAWLEDEENCYGCPGDHICGWILHYPE